MKTLLLEDYEIEEAVAILQRDGVVAIPTETVYGIAAKAYSESACRRIFEIKNRPLDNPLIIHCADIQMVNEIVDSSYSASTGAAMKLLKKFSPGPLTVIVPASRFISATARAGGNTIAIRIPAHPLCREIIKHLGKALAAPSANLSGRPSATNALMAWEALAGRVDAVVDGGSCEYGLESTIVDCTREPLRIVREGSLSAKMIFEKSGFILKNLNEILSEKISESAAQYSDNDEHTTQVIPGSKYRHYAPKCTVCSFSDTAVLKSYHNHTKIGIAYLLHETKNMTGLDMSNIAFSRAYENWTEMAKGIYELFAEADRRCLSILYVSIPKQDEHPALYDRIHRAMKR